MTLMKLFGLLLFCVICLECVVAVPKYFLEEHCSQTLALNYGSIEAVRLHLSRSPNYPERMACSMRVQAPTGKRLSVKIETFDVIGVPDLMCQTGDYVQMIDGMSGQAVPLQGLAPRVCTRPIAEEYTTTGPYFVISFMSDADLQTGKGISLLITAFTEGPCAEDQFQCGGSGRCIQKSLTCDGYKSCPDGSDEAMPMCLSTAATGIIIVAAVLIFIIVVVLIIAIVIRHQRMKRARIIKRAMAHERLSNSLWCESKTGRLDVSQIDPIWDGGLSAGGSEPDTQSRRSGSVYSFNGHTGTNTPVSPQPSYATISNTRNLSTRRILPADMTADDPSWGGDVSQIPSSFWDVQIQELTLVAKQLDEEMAAREGNQTSSTHNLVDSSKSRGSKDSS